MTAIAVDPAPYAPLPLTGHRRYDCPLCGGKNDFSVSLEKWSCWKCQKWAKWDEAPRQAQHTERVTQQAAEDAEKKLLSDRRKWKACKPIALVGTPGQAYLRGRGIPLFPAQSNGVVWAPCLRYKNKLRSGALLFPLKDENGALSGYQVRWIAGEDNTRNLYNPDRTGKGLFLAGKWGADFAITEAPIDALSYLLIYKMPCVSMQGTQSLPMWLIEKARGHTVYIAPDNDEPGDDAAKRWAAQLKGVCKRIRRRPTGKDWNVDLKGA